ncbi:MAG TPA: hypothetical protein VI122_03920 [Thermoleophilaceae bacterium]
MRRALLVIGVLGLTAGATALPAGAHPLTVNTPVNLSIPSPFPPGCGDATEGNFPGINFNYQNSESEPWVAVSPTNPNDVAAFRQQDRWSDGGAHGLLAAVSHNGGDTWVYSNSALQPLCRRDRGQRGRLRSLVRPVGVLGAQR